MDVLFITLIIALNTIIVIEMALYADEILNKKDLQTEGLYTQNAVAEEVLSAPCATETRGVFYKSALTSGDLRCLHPDDFTVIETTISGKEYAWIIVKDGGDTKVLAATAPRVLRAVVADLVGDVDGPREFVNKFGAATTHRYQIQMYDTETGERTVNTIRVTGG